MMEITFDRKTIGTSLLQRFTLPTYQREYRWEMKHLQELIIDIQEEFLENYDPSHGRSKVGEYSPYFLGTIITTPGESGTRSIVDGQQRLTTLAIILSYFHRASQNAEGGEISDVEPLIRRRVFGASEFNLEFDADRARLFEILLDRTDVHGEDLDELVDSIPNCSESTKHIYRLFGQIENIISEDVKEGLLPRFVDYITERVYLFEIGVPSEQDGHKVFVTMNDRGLRLAPIDLLKGYLLSNISDAEASASANNKWASTIRDLRVLGRDEDSTFFKTWLRGQYAVSSRGKNRGDAPADFEIVGDAYHRWVVENVALLGLADSDEYYDLVERAIPFFVNQYKRVRTAEETFSQEFPHIFYNGSRNINLQYLAIVAALDVNDTSATVDKKIRAVSYFIYAFITSRVVTGRANNYDNIKDPIFSLAKRIRRQPLSVVIDTLSGLMDEFSASFDQIPSLMYWSIKRQDLLHLLARMATYLEDEIDLTNRVGFDEYVNRTKGNRTFDVEHAVSYKADAIIGINNGEPVRASLEDLRQRNRVGYLLLLPRGRNRSMRDMHYPDKLSRYATENVLAQTLTEEFYLSHPNVPSFVARTGIDVCPEAIFNTEAAQRRATLYVAIAKKIWSKEGLIQVTE
jgi:hypothetical protein